MTTIKPKWVVFDVGGVLLDWVKSSDYLASRVDVSQEVLLETMFSYALKMNIGLLDAREGWEKILKDLDREVMEPIEAIRHWRDKRFWIQDSLELASELHKANYKLAIFTNSWLGLEDEEKRNLLPNELSLFSNIVDSSKEGSIKPEEKFYKILENKIGSREEEILLIDDTPKNMPVAESRKWQTFLFETNRSLDSVNQLRSILL